MEQAPFRTALVTGASSGLGRGFAKWFAARGTKVFAAARREEQLTELAEEVNRAGGDLEPVVMDVANAAQTVEQIRGIDQRCGGLDLVIANAGIGGETAAGRAHWPSMEKVIHVNVTGAAATLTAVLPQMVERNHGHLVAVSSLAAFRGLPKSAAYSASKAFVATFMESLRVDLSGTNVRATTLYPGFVKTELTAKNRFKMPFLLETDDAVERMCRAIVRGDAEFAFPWQLSSVMSVARWLPNPLWTTAAKRLR